MLPTLTLGLIFLAIYLRIMRASMLEVLTSTSSAPPGRRA